MLAAEVEKSFALLVLSLGLTAEGPKPRSFLAKGYPFSFYVSDAIQVMQDMHVSICNGSTKTTISFRAQTESAAMKLLHRFMLSRLIHCPSDRTREELKPSVLVQPTAKGVHFVERYCLKQSISMAPVEDLIDSVYNSMRCIPLDRRPRTDEIEESETFACLLFQRLLGPFPNVYSPENEFEDIVVDKRDSSCFHSSSSNIIALSKESFPARRSFDSVRQASPYAHRYFTHPDSASVTQYYLSTQGVRTFYDVIKGHYFSGKACWQWLMECTDAMYSREALGLGDLFLKYGLMEPVHGPRDRLVRDREVFYTVTGKGRRVCLWSEGAASDSSVFDSEAMVEGMSLEAVLCDVGLRLLFRDYLAQNYCEENLMFYVELEKFTAGCASLGDPMEEKQVRELISAAYTMYNRFIATNSACEINISSELREQLRGQLDGNRRIDAGSLSVLEPLLSEARHQVYRMMEQDSLSKFLHSHEFRSRLNQLSVNLPCSTG